MKTAEILDKYRKILVPIINCKPENLKFMVKVGTNWEEIGTIDYDKDDISIHWNLGEYNIVEDKGDTKVVISSWKLYQLQHCCAFMVSCNVIVEHSYRNRRIGTILNQLRQDIGRLLGYSAIICTDIDKNENQRKLLETNGWKDIHSIVNKRTNNRVYLSVINI